MLGKQGMVGPISVSLAPLDSEFLGHIHLPSPKNELQKG